MFDNINLFTSFVFITASLIIFWLWFLYFKKRENFSIKYKLFFSDKNTSYSLLFLIISFFILLIWIFDFKWGELKTENEVSGIDIVFVLDVSKSMNVLDYKDWKYVYSRLDAAKSMISNYVGKHSENRFWLIVFAWDAISVSPLTTDSSTFLTLLSNVDYRNLASQWSDFEKAIELWVDRFNDDDRAKAMVLISDWWDEEDKIDYSYIKNLVRDKNISSFVFGVWTLEWWKILTWYDALRRAIYQRYNWEFVISKLNESNLKKIASSLGGVYFSVDNLEKIWEYINWLEKKIIEVSSSKIEKSDWTRVLAFISFILFLVYLIYPVFRKKYENK